ncbi:condensation domain-containing protein [Moorena producens JHB]|uniref:Condensation domain-containing protein n=1 Tax=Moorena producens (strain JHB) TaxID=1454205 RepID=A0A1D9FYP1_MOOP1|nr:condensation domain-containing protein [Moorena producens]AOY80290.1 condensation domain-containing protein [Moorena producens JHB]
MASSTPKESSVNPSSQTESESLVSDFWKSVKTNIKLKHQAPPIKPVQRNGNLPLSFAQERLWYLDQLQPGNSFHNMRIALRLQGVLNIEALEQSLREIVCRHEILRTTFTAVDGKPIQVISPNISPNTVLELPVVDLQKLPKTERETETQRLATEEAEKPFDLAQGPLWRCKLLRLSAEEHVLISTIHHIIFDGWSNAVFWREMVALYEAFVTGKPSPLPKLLIQYADFAQSQRQWLQGQVLESQLDYWKQQLRGNVPQLELPIDYPKPTVPTHQGRLQYLALSKHLTKALKTLSHQEGVSLFVTLLAAFKTLLYRYTGQEDMIVCSPVASRNRVQTKKLIGYFNNIVVVRTGLGGNPSFREVIGRVSQVTLGATQHQDLPFQKLADLVPIPLSRGMFALQNTPSQPEQMADITVSLLPSDRQMADFDLFLSMKERGGQLQGRLQYKTDLFEAATITQMLENFQALLESVIANPDRHLEELPSFGKANPIDAVGSSSAIAIEPGEIETVLAQHPDVEESLVTIQEDPPGEKCLIVYVVPNQKQVPSLKELRRFLKQKLPNYRVPSRFVPLEAMPLTPDGNVDYTALPAPHLIRQTPEQAYVAPRTPIEQKLAEIWAKVLWRDQDVGIHDNFFDLGGHSLLSMRLVAEIEEAFQKRLPLASLSQLGTIAELASFLEQAAESTPTPSVLPLISPPSSPFPELSPEIYRKLLAYNAGRKGQRAAPNSLIVAMNTSGTKQPLFWCSGRFQLVVQLAEYLGEDQPTYAMNSGQSAMEYTNDNIKALAAHYVREILTIQPSGSYLLGGYCSGGTIAFEIAQQLLSQGKTITLLCLLEKFIPQLYPGRVALFFGRESEFNPYKSFQNLELGWRKFYQGGLSIDLLSGAHTQFWYQPHIHVFIPKLQAAIENAQREETLQTAIENPQTEETGQIFSEKAYRAEFVAQQSLVASAGETISIPITVKNISPVTWLSTHKSAIRLGNHWLDQTTEVIQWSDGRVDLPSDLPPGEEIELSLQVTTPVKSGHYWLELDLVEEGITWFKDFGSQTTTVEVSVNPEQETITLEQDNPEVYRCRGHWEFEKGDVDRAIINYQKALQLDPSGPVEVYQNLGDALSQQKQFPLAITAYTKALQLQPDNGHVYFRLGNAQLEEKELDSAIASYQKAIELAPASAWIHQNLGKALHKQGQLESAIANYTKAIKLQPDMPELYVQLSSVQLRLGQIESAIANYKEAIRLLNPGNLWVYCQLGKAYLRGGDRKAAITCYQKVIEIDPSYAEAYRHLGNALTHFGELESAIAYYQKAIELQPDNPNVYHMLGNAQLKKGDLGNAIASYQKVIELNPKQFRAYTNLGHLFNKLGQLDQAYAAYTKAIQLQPKSRVVARSLENLRRKKGGM